MKPRLWLLTCVVVLANVAGNVIIKQAMLNAPPDAGIIASILQPVAILGIAVLSAWMLLRMWLLGMADLSFVVPISAVGYVLSAFAGVYFFQERVPARGWIGTVLIMLGAALTGLTEHSSPPSAPSASSDPRPQAALLPSRPFQSRPFQGRDRQGAVLPDEPRPDGAVPPSEPRPQGAVLASDPRPQAALLPSRPFQSRDRQGAVLPSDPRPQEAVLADDPRPQAAAPTPAVTNS